MDTPYRHPRSRRLARRATFCLLTALLPGLFLASALLGSGGLWSPLFWGALAVVAVPAVAAAGLLWRVRRLEGEAVDDAA